MTRLMILGNIPANNEKVLILKMLEISKSMLSSCHFLLTQEQQVKVELFLIINILKPASLALKEQTVPLLEPLTTSPAEYSKINNIKKLIASLF